MEEEADRTREVDVPPRCFCFKCAELIENAGDRESTSAWHYHEEKQQFHFVCGTEGCRAETDILGQYGHCPRDCKTNARKLFPEPMQTLLRKKTVLSRENRGEVWEDMIVKTVSHFEALMRHLTLKLIGCQAIPRGRCQTTLLEIHRQQMVSEN